MKPGFIHNVYFYLKEGINENEKQAWIDELLAMEKIESVMSLYGGPPANTPRDVVDNSYDYTISVYFTSRENHDAYQADPIHHQMIDNHKHLWERVVVFDNLVD